jgi:ribonuclease D
MSFFKDKMNYNTSITKEDMVLFPVEQFPGHTIVVDHINDVRSAVSYLSTFDYVGFDTETRPNFKTTQHHKVSLIQLSTPNRCYLFRLNKLGGIPPQLEDFLKNGSTIKIGISLLDDFNGIRKYMDFKPDNFIDLQKIIPSYGIQDASLQKIYAILFGKRISKRMRLSNWDSVELTEAQKKYAALDAWACLQIYQQLNLSQ